MLFRLSCIILRRSAPLLIIAVTTACSGQNAPPSTPSGLQTYESVDQIAALLLSGGFTCTGLVLDAAPNIAVQQGRCTNSSHEDTVLALYTSPIERDTEVNGLIAAEVGVPIDWGVVSGGNWSVDCSSMAAAKQVRALMGGKVAPSSTNN